MTDDEEHEDHSYSYTPRNRPSNVDTNPSAEILGSSAPAASNFMDRSTLSTASSSSNRSASSSLSSSISSFMNHGIHRTNSSASNRQKKPRIGFGERRTRSSSASTPQGQGTRATINNNNNNNDGNADSSESGDARDQPPLASVPKIGKIGVCAMDSKARSKPCRTILNKLIEHGEFETVIFGEKVILDEAIENWPTCDFLICFFSTGFPLQKAIKYAEKRKPYLVNDLELQKVLWDRRLVLHLLDACDVPSPHRVVVSRDGGPRVDDKVKAKLLKHGVNLKPENELTWEMSDDGETMIFSDGQTITKPFVEKPVDGEDHNIYVYYNKAKGGGGRRLFRKVGNKSSDFDSSLNVPRTQGSYIYEKYMGTDNLEDVKAYTVGKQYCHAETRKSPVVDGVVRRNTYGKELRFVTKLQENERKMASSICAAFEQTICGFDLLRVEGKSYVIDVNGFSFVKDNDDYYDNCSRILRQLFMKAKRQRTTVTSTNREELDTKEEKQQKWVLKGQVGVIRHADRTPKQKFKYSFRSRMFIDLLQGHLFEVIIREHGHLLRVLNTVNEGITQGVEDVAKLTSLKKALEKKMDLPGTKVQIKPLFRKDTDTVEKVQLIVKWGGEPTHSARYQTMDLGVQLRKDVTLLNKNCLDDVQVFSSSERRVVASANLFSSSYLEAEELPDSFISIRKDLLDDSNAAKDLMDQVKKKLKPLLRQGIEPPPQFAWPPKVPEPFVVLSRVVDLMIYHQKVMDYNFATKNIDEFQSRWCCSEDPELFKERWDKLFGEFVTVDKVDPSKISELYDTMKFDGMHNRQFLEKVFLPDPDLDFTPPPLDTAEWHVDPAEMRPETRDTASPVMSESSNSSATHLHNILPHHHHNHNHHNHNNNSEGYGNGEPNKRGPFDKQEYTYLRELYRLAKILFDFICPQEYGIEDKEKLDIGLLTSMPLVKQILQDIDHMKETDTGGASVFYFTKESHIYTLLNIIFESQVPTRLARNSLPELDYLTQISFELYESEDPTTLNKRYSIRITISPGCNTQAPLDVQLDSKHCISCIPRQALTRHLDCDLVVSRLRNRFSRVNMPRKFLPVNITSSSAASSVKSTGPPSSSAETTPIDVATSGTDSSY